MKKISVLLFAFLLTGCTLPAPNQSPGNSYKKNFDEAACDTAGTADYLSPLERAVIKEMNLARTNPGLYAEKYIEPMLSQFNGTIFTGYGFNLQTTEGAAAVRECVTIMKTKSPMAALNPDEGLAKAAKDWVAIQSPTSEIGHGTGENYFVTRIQKYGTGWCNYGENISYGYNDARRIVIQLLVDDGLTTRGHRENIFGNYTHVGVACGTHKAYGYMCVQDFGTK